MRPVRRHDAAHGLLLHVLKLRQQHRLRLTGRHNLNQKGACGRPSSFQSPSSANRAHAKRYPRCPPRVHIGQREPSQGRLEFFPPHGTHAWIARCALSRDKAPELDEIPDEEEATRLENARGF